MTVRIEFKCFTIALTTHKTWILPSSQLHVLFSALTHHTGTSLSRRLSSFLPEAQLSVGLGCSSSTTTVLVFLTEVSAQCYHHEGPTLLTLTPVSLFPITLV